MAPALDFFVFYGSIHTSLSAMRIEALAAPQAIEIRWRPFNLRAILIEQNNTAFARNPVSLAYIGSRPRDARERHSPARARS